MLYLTTTIIAFLCFYILLLHHKLRDVSELIKESSVLTENNASSQQSDYYLKFSIDKDFNVVSVNDDLLKYGKFKADELIGKNVLGTLFENITGNEEFLAECKRRLKRKKQTFSCEQTIMRANNKQVPVLLRVRPLLNEKLAMKGIDFWCYPLNRRIKLEKQLKNIKQKDQISGDIYNAETFIRNLEKSVRAANFHGQKLCLAVVDFADVYEFVASGFSFNTGDKLIRLISEACVETCGNNATIGRFDTTKIGLIFSEKDCDNERIKEITETLWEKIITNIRKLNVDKANAGMVCLFYTQMHRFYDSADNMLSRSRIYLKNSRFCHNYGIGCVDKNQRG